MKQLIKKVQGTNFDTFAVQFNEKYPNKEDLIKLEYELGIDEAGRGAVMGPMVYCAFWWPKIYSDKFKELGFNDSKELKQEERNYLFTIINNEKDKIFFYEVDIISPDYLSKNMQRQNATNLNIISHNSAIKLLRRALSQGFIIKNVYVDTVGDALKYQKYIKERVTEYQHIISEIKVQPKADRDHKVVSAASICAKVTRDKSLREWKFIENLQFEQPLGSGYPSDPTTQSWLVKYQHKIFGFPNLIRFSWQTCTNILQKCCELQVKDEKSHQSHQGLNELLRKQIDLFDLIKPVAWF